MQQQRDSRDQQRARNSTIQGMSADAFLGKIYFDKSFIDNEISVDNESNFFLSGNVTLRGGIKDFEGQMTRNYDVITMPLIQLSVLDKDMGKTLWNSTADDSGHANFDLVFRPANYTDHLLINGEAFNSTSTTPLTVN
jgi:hypothetical protein